MKTMKKVLLPTCFQSVQNTMSSQTVFGIQTIQNEIYCNSSEDYTVINHEDNEAIHQRCSSKSSGTSSVDTFTLKARMENLEIALTMLRENFQRMEHAMNKQIEKAIDLIIGSKAREIQSEKNIEEKTKSNMRTENKKLTKAVKFLTESSRIMRTALSEHTKVIDHLTYVMHQPVEVSHNVSQKRDKSPTERVINTCKIRKQKDMVQIVYPKALNPLEVSDYLAVENTMRNSPFKPPCSSCKLKNNETLLKNNQSPTCLYVNYNKNNNAFLKCNCRMCVLEPAVDPDGDYVTLLRDYITTGKCNAAYEYYNKTSMPDLTAYTNVNEQEDSADMFNEREGTLV